MQHRKLAVLFSIIFITGLTVAYGGEGVGTDAAQCVDGIDNDGSGAADGDGAVIDGEEYPPDPACTEPYYLDDSEYSMYDTGAAYVFDQGVPNDIFGPSVFYGSRTIHQQQDEDGNIIDVTIRQDYNISSNNEYIQTYMVRSKDTWGGEENKTETIDFPSTWTVTNHPSGDVALSTTPHPDAEDDENRCGDSMKFYDDNEGDSLNEKTCPEDWGLPGNFEANPYRTVREYSDNTISETLGDYTVSFDANYRTSHTQDVTYDPPNMYVEESRGEEKYDITGEESNNAEKHYEFGGDDDGTTTWDNGVDFYLAESSSSQGGTEEIRVVYPVVKETVDIGTVTNHYVSDHDEETVDDFDGTTTVTTYEGEEATDPRPFCTEVDDAEVSHYEVDDDPSETTVGPISTDVLENAAEDNDIGYDDSNDEENSNQFSINVTYDTVSDVGKEYQECTSWESYYTNCVGECADANPTNYTASELDYIPDSRTGEVTFKYDDMAREDELVYSLNPKTNDNHHVSVREGLFDGDSFKGSIYTPEDDDGGAGGGEIPYVRDGGKTHFSYRIGFNDEYHQGNSYSVSRSVFRIDIDGEEFVSNRTEINRMNADGVYGHGDGFVMLTHDVDDEDQPSETRNDYWEITGSSPGFGDERCIACSTNTEIEDSDFVVPDDDSDDPDFSLIEDLMKNEENIEGCPEDYHQCVASIDLELKNLNEWSSSGTLGSSPSSDPRDGVRIDVEGPYDVSQSLGLAMMYDDYADGDVNTHYSGGPPQDPEDDECDSNRAGNWDVQMKGPAVNESLADEHQAAYEGCITEHSSCILHGDEVPEGYVSNVASDQVDAEYEAGGDSPDWEVCLNIEDPVNTPGAEWYDLDSEAAQDYLYEDHDLLDTGEGSRYNISYYWQYNPNPQHDEYNPRGNSWGLALESNCGNPEFDGYSGELQDNQGLQCSDAGDEHSRLNPAGFTYSFFVEGHRDDDYHPQGKDTVDITNQDQVFYGYVSMLKDMSDQLEPGMATTTYNMSDPDSDLEEKKWYTTVGGEDYANQWALAVDPSWSIDATGTPYPPWGSYYRDPENRRTSNEADGRSKVQKAYGNSYAAVAGPGLDGELDYNGTRINESDGVWIDPDDLRWAWTAQGGDLFQWPEYTYDGTPADNWTDMLRLDIDLTGPDSGLGYDVPGADSYRHRTDEYGNSNTLVYGDIIWETEDGSGISDPYPDGVSHPVEPGVEPHSDLHPELEPYMCGDDSREYLVEQMGESPNSDQLTGPYGCASRPDICFDGGSNQFVTEGNYLQTNEPGEETGRLKQDDEYCGINPENLGTWYDQDFSQEACRENSLYGNLGKTWIPADYVQSHPYAVNEGIDDSWNEYMNTKHGDFSEYERYDAEASWDSNTDFESQMITPIDTGTNHSYTASLGFCAGDDASEYMITQQSQTRFIENDNSVIGVAASPDSCVLANDRDEIDSTETERMLYQEGERETVTSGGTTRQIACFNGQWWGDWPVVFLENQANLELGETGYSTFNVINPESTSRTIELTLSFEDENLERMTTFAGSGTTEMDVEIPAESSGTFDIKIEGNREIDSSDDNSVELQGVSSRGDLNGYDNINIVVGEGGEIGNDRGNVRDVPGLQAIQLIIIALVSSIVFFFKS